MGRRGRDRQQPDENCGLANETIVAQTSQTKSRVTPNLSVSSLSVKSACFSQAQSSTRSPESATKNSLRMSLESQSGPLKFSCKKGVSCQKLARSRGGPAVSLRSDNGRRSVRFCLGKIWGTIGEKLFPIKVISARIRAHRPM